MTEDLRRCLEDNMDLALSHGYTMSQRFSLGDNGGYYMPPSYLVCHPLETVVLGQKITSPINVDIAINLGVHPSWVDGFSDGYGSSGPLMSGHDASYMALHRNDPLRRRYMEGFEDGHGVKDWTA